MARRLPVRFASLMLGSMVLLLQGCVVGQTIKMDTAAAAPASNVPVHLQVSDDRPYVVSGDKPPYYIGKYRAGIGIPYDVSTDDHVPLKDVIEKDLTRRLQAFGAAADKVLVKVSIRDWNFDAYQNGKFSYDLEVTASNLDGSAAQTQTLKNQIGVSGTFWGGGKGGFERDMPGIFEQVMSKVVAPNGIVAAAMERVGGASQAS